jgi:hypothetical protein
VKTKRIVLGVLACALVSAVAYAQNFMSVKELLTGYEGRDIGVPGQN